MVKAVIDSDGGIDDLLAIILAIRSKELDLLGVTTVEGAMGRDGANFIRYIVSELDESIPVIRGKNKPLKRELRTAKHVHGGLYNILPLHYFDFSKLDPVEYVTSILKENTETNIICTGPLTNIANLVVSCDYLDNVSRLYIMGGALHSQGNFPPEAKRKIAEYNIFSDPEAAEAVFGSGMDITLVTLDSTQNKIVCDAGKLGSDQADPISLTLNAFYRAYDGRSLHDPVTVAVAIDEQIGRYEQTGISVDCKEDIGRTMISPYRDNVRLCTSVNRDRFFQLFNRYVNQQI